MKVVLDANIAIAAMNGVQTVVERLGALRGADVGIPIVAIAELAYGARRSSRPTQNLGRIASLRRNVSTLPLTEAVADRYAIGRAELESRGQTKSDFDLLIACTALEQGATRRVRREHADPCLAARGLSPPGLDGVEDPRELSHPPGGGPCPCWSYVDAHRAEIEEAIRANEAA